MTSAARSPRRGSYRPAPDVQRAMAAPWQPTHRQLEQFTIGILGERGWLVHVIHDSRTEHWTANSGWPDIFAVKDGRAVALEVKVGADDLKAEQVAWLTALNEVPGIEAYRLRSTGDQVADAQAIVELLNPPRGKPGKQR